MEFNLYKTYLSFIKKSVDSRMFQSVYFSNKRQILDIAQEGQLSCAVYVSSVLRIFGLIQKGHATVEGTMKDMKKSGWYEIPKPKKGAVLVWEAKKFKGGMHRHNGFYMGRGKAISNSATKRSPQVHHWTYNNTRKVEKIFWHRKLGQNKL